MFNDATVSVGLVPSLAFPAVSGGITAPHKAIPSFFGDPLRFRRSDQGSAWGASEIRKYGPE